MIGSPAEVHNGTIQIAGPGDANLDGLFDSSDMVLVFQAGQYEDGVPGNSDWTTGDWDGDGDFTSLDMVLAFQQGTYEKAATPGSIFRPVREDIAAALIDDPGLLGDETIGDGSESVRRERIAKRSTARPTLDAAVLIRSVFERIRRESALCGGTDRTAETADRLWRDLREDGVVECRWRRPVAPDPKSQP